MSTLALQRLAEERKAFRKSRPYGFTAKPVMKSDGSVNLMEWNCVIPGTEKSLSDGAKYPCTIRFPPDYPSKSPRVYMPKGFFHVNICPRTGSVCLSILKDDVPAHLGNVTGWAPSMSISQILLSLQELLVTPNYGSVLGREAYDVWKSQGQAEYDRRTQLQARKYSEEVEVCDT
ncbi:hypothetical protein CEUSTIGMA_g9279.t1 [Chlamydomonas eustigma]|uniref:UBC core domain-containing protein n=1 Tax=Chlamydomonas eustigma TaxID=1157962 RepID=A0A250XFJ9_9CHLO|nr:hypothetical protein CEUSTIGMA_g9279.t1 [Chlamydomonas eustigma]|eukprot:GAX81851.1 hypothetical protein CEUSTIGMA_g9279.t1 [Chlamydomonas eustigma]